MKKTLLFALLCLTLVQTAHAQRHFGWASATSYTNNGIAFDQYSNIVLAGTFSGTTDFDLGPGVSNLVGAGMGDIFVQKLDPAGNLLWAKGFGGLLQDAATSVDVDVRGDILVTGYFTGTVFFAPNISFTTPPDSAHLFILKLNDQGDLLWARHINATNAIAQPVIKTDLQGNSYCAGSFRGTTDFDPDPNNSFVLNAPAQEAMFLLKLNPMGQLIWAKQMDGGANGYSKPYALALERDYVYVTGQFTGTVDFDPGNGTKFLTAQNGDAFTQKLDSDGNLVWVKQIGKIGGSIGYSIAVDQQENVLTTGYFTSEIDIDPGADSLVFTSAGISDIFIQELSPDGDLVWGKQIGAPGRDQGNAVAVDRDGSIYTTGYFESVVDFDPGTGISELHSVGIYDMYLLRLNANGDFVDAKAIGGAQFDGGKDIVFDHNDNAVLLGSFGSTVDFDPGPGTFLLTASGGSSAFILKLVGPWDYHGTVFQDLNGNQVQDAGEPGMPGILVGTKSGDAFASTNYAGAFHFYRPLEGDTLFAVAPHTYWEVAPVSIPVDSLQGNTNFAMINHFPLNKDVCIAAIESQPFRPGTTTAVNLQVRNVGTVALDSIPISLKIVTQPSPGVLGFKFSLPPPLSNTDETFNWLVGPLDTQQMVEIIVIFNVPVVPIGTPVSLSAAAELDDDIFPSNNGSRIQTNTIGPYDPNDKQVTPSSVPPESLDTTTLRYVIRFQNTGNYPAEFVIIRDTLPEGLDLSMLKMLAASHPYTWRLYDDRVLEFRFDPIDLPDSTANEPASHGFIAFTAQAKSGLHLGDVISNRAGIYFDYNAPVITSYAVMQVANVVQVSTPTEAPWLDFDLSPNPVAAFSSVAVVLPEISAGETTVSVIDAIGRILQHISVPKGGKQFYLDGLPAGSYFVQVRAGKLVGGKVLIVK